MKHHQIISHPNRPARSIYYEPRKRLTNPMVDVISVAVLAVILVVAHFIQN
jgi:hypothetical protein